MNISLVCSLLQVVEAGTICIHWLIANYSHFRELIKLHRSIVTITRKHSSLYILEFIWEVFLDAPCSYKAQLRRIS